MENVILQPASDKKAKKHFHDTVLNPVELDIMKEYIDDPLYERIKNLYPDGKVYVWGITNGKQNAKKTEWKKIKPGDICVFTQDKKIFKSAVITLTFANKELAARLWGVDMNGETWENIYLVDELINLDISYETFNEIIGYKHNYIIQGFRYLNDEKSEKILSELDLHSTRIMDDISKEEYDSEIEKLMDKDHLDRPVSSTSRVEQAYLRKVLFDGKTEYRCGICGNVYPIDLLITAHIKKRADCSKEERLDAAHIAMPMCKFGCDDLYEKGYLLVEKGVIKANKRKQMTKYVEEYINKIKDKECEYWTDDTKKYFEAHNKTFIDQDSKI